MHEQSREILPVAVTDLERQKQIHEDIAAQITESLDNPQGMPESSKDELVEHHGITMRRIGDLATEITIRLQQVA